MNLLMPILLSFFLTCVFDQAYCKANFNFLENLPDKIESAWRNFISVLSQPVHPKRLGTTGRLKARYRTTTPINFKLISKADVWHPIRPVTTLYDDQVHLVKPMTTMGDVKVNPIKSMTSSGDEVVQPIKLVTTQGAKKVNDLDTMPPDPFSDNLVPYEPLKHNFKIEFGPKVPHMKKRNPFPDLEETTLGFKNKVVIPFLVRPRGSDNEVMYDENVDEEIKMITKDRNHPYTRVLRYSYSDEIDDETNTKSAAQTKSDSTKLRSFIKDVVTHYK